MAALVERIHEQKELAILIARRIEIFLVFAGEFPIVEQCVPVAVRGRVRIEPGGKHSRYRGRLRPEFDVEEISRICQGGGGLRVDLPFGVSG